MPSGSSYAILHSSVSPNDPPKSNRLDVKRTHEIGKAHRSTGLSTSYAQLPVITVAKRAVDANVLIAVIEMASVRKSICVAPTRPVVSETHQRRAVVVRGGRRPGRQANPEELLESLETLCGCGNHRRALRAAFESGSVGELHVLLLRKQI